MNWAYFATYIFGVIVGTILTIIFRRKKTYDPPVVGQLVLVDVVSDDTDNGVFLVFKEEYLSDIPSEAFVTLEVVHKSE